VVDKLRPDPVLMDVRVGQRRGIAAGQQPAHAHGKLRIVGLTACSDTTPMQQDAVVVVVVVVVVVALC
jgi:DNA-binding NarL/FixJ family response regulator